MKLYTLGTGSCAISPTRHNVSTLLEQGDNLYLFDAGSPADALMTRANKDIAKLRAVFVTHMHLDHVGALPNIVRAVSGLEKPEQPIFVFLPEARGYTSLNAWLEATHTRIDKKLFRFLETTKSPNLYEDESITVGALPTDHIKGDMPISYAYTVDSKEGSVLLTGDLSCDLRDYPAMALERDFDVCVCEATHYAPEDAVDLFSQSRFGQLILTHIHTPWQSKKAKASLRALYHKLPFPVWIAEDGAEYTIRP